jgi:ergothioneine biosynthesis protein EgtB
MQRPVREAEAAPAASELSRGFAEIRAATRSLAAPLGAEDCAIQSMPDASPVKWHLAHTTWFFETFVLERESPGRTPFHPAFRMLFNSYYNAVGDRHPRPQRGLLSRPTLEDVLRYRTQVEDEVMRLLERGGANAGTLRLVELGLHHEQQHQELILTDLKHLLSCNPLRPAYQKNWPLSPVRPGAPRWIPVGGGHHEIGHDGDGFAFDNESPRHAVWLEDFELRSHPVTHGDFVAFIADGGYERPELWLSAGWDAVAARGWKAPLYWERIDGRMAHLHAAWPRARRAQHAGVPRELLRSRSIRPLGGRAPAQRSGMGSRHTRHGDRGKLPRVRNAASPRAARRYRTGYVLAGFRRRVGMDAQRLRSLSGIPHRRGSGG